MKQNKILGIDIGGSGIKGALIDIDTGSFLTNRIRIATPSPPTPKSVTTVFKQLVNSFDYQGPVGVGFPAVLKDGIALTAANIDKAWIGTNVVDLFESAIGQQVFIANDADLAGLAELQFGAGSNAKYHQGTTLMITVGTGLGSALFYNGILIPNTEFGHFQLKGMIAEHYASNGVRKREGLDWEKWGIRLNLYLLELEKLLAPNHIILGGGGSKYFEEIKPFLTVNAPVIAAHLGNKAGIIGAAFLAYENLNKKQGVKERH